MPPKLLEKNSPFINPWGAKLGPQTVEEKSPFRPPNGRAGSLLAKRKEGRVMGGSLGSVGNIDSGAALNLVFQGARWKSGKPYKIRRSGEGGDHRAREGGVKPGASEEKRSVPPWVRLSPS